MEDNTTGGSDFNLEVELRYDRALADLEKFFNVLQARSTTALGDIKFDVKPVEAAGKVSEGAAGRMSSLVERTDALTVSMEDLRRSAGHLARAMGDGYARKFLEHAQAMMSAADDSVVAQTANMRKMAELDAQYTNRTGENDKKRRQAQVRTYTEILKATDKFTDEQLKRLAQLTFGRRAVDDAMLTMEQRVQRRLRELTLAEMSMAGEEQRKARNADHARRLADIRQQGDEAAKLAAKNDQFSEMPASKRRRVIDTIMRQRARIAREIANLPADAERSEVAERAETNLMKRYGNLAVGVADNYRQPSRSGFLSLVAKEQYLGEQLALKAAETLQDQRRLQAEWLAAKDGHEKAKAKEADKATQAETRRQEKYRRIRLQEAVKSLEAEAREDQELLAGYLKQRDALTAKRKAQADKEAKELQRARERDRAAEAADEARQVRDIQTTRNKAHAQALADIRKSATARYSAASKDRAFERKSEEDRNKVLADIADQRARVAVSLREANEAYTPEVAKLAETKLIRQFGPAAVAELDRRSSLMRVFDPEAVALMQAEMVELQSRRRAMVGEELNLYQKLAAERLQGVKDLERAERARFASLSRLDQAQILTSLRQRLAAGEQVRDQPQWLITRAQGYTPAESRPREQSALRAMLGLDGERMYRDLGNQWHSGVRGVTGVTGGTWMTYGDIIPIVTAAAATAMAYYTTSKGATYSRDLAYVRELSRTPELTGAKLNDRTSELSDNLLQRSRYSGYSATEQIKSVRTLAQAGYSAEQANSMVPQVNALATVGDTTTDTAAITLAGTLSAFQMDASQASRVANVMAMAANESQTSVESLNESMKQASSVASEYGVSLEDTATVLALLAKRNIVGSAAGTAFKNMMVDLGGRTKQSTKYIQQLGVELYDTATGRAKALPVVLDQVIAKLSTLSQRERNFYMHKIFTERGIKPVSAVLGEGMDEYGRMKSRISDAQSGGGYVVQAEQRLNEGTAAGQWKMLKNSVEAEAIEAFLQSEGELIESLQRIRDELNGGGLSSAIQNFTGLVSGGVSIVSRFSGEITALLGGVAAYGTLRAFGGGIAVVSAQAGLAAGALSELISVNRSAAAATATTSTAMNAAAATSNAASVGVRRLGVAFRFLQLSLPIIGAVTAATLLFADAATESAEEVAMAIDKVDYSRMAQDMSDGYQEVHRRGREMYEGLTSAGSAYASKDAKTVQEAIENGNRLLKAADETQKYLTAVSAGTATQIQGEYRDRQQQIIRSTFEDAKRLYDGTAENRMRLLELAERAANEEIRIEREKMDEIVRINSGATASKLQQLVKTTRFGTIKDDGGFTRDSSLLVATLKAQVQPAIEDLMVGKQVGRDQITKIADIYAAMPQVLKQMPELRQDSDVMYYTNWAGKVLQGNKPLQERDARQAFRVQASDIRGIVNSPNRPTEGSPSNRTAERAEDFVAQATMLAAERERSRTQLFLDLAQASDTPSDLLEMAFRQVNEAQLEYLRTEGEKRVTEMLTRAKQLSSSGKPDEAAKIAETMKLVQNDNAAIITDTAEKHRLEREERTNKQRALMHAARTSHYEKSAALSMSLIRDLGEDRVRQEFRLLDLANQQADVMAAKLDKGTSEERQTARITRERERALEIARREVALRRERMGERMYAAGSNALTSSLTSGANEWFRISTSGRARQEFEQQNGRRFSVAEDVVRPAGAAAATAVFGSLVEMGAEKIQLGMRDAMRFLLDDDKFGETVEEAQLQVLRDIYQKLPGGLDATPVSGAVSGAPVDLKTSGGSAQQTADAYKTVGDAAQATSSAVGQNTQMMFSMMTSAVVAFSTRGKSSIKQFAVSAVMELLKVYMMQRMVGAMAGMGGGPAGAAAAVAGPAAGMSAMGMFAATAAGTAVGGFLSGQLGGSGSQSSGQPQSTSTVMQAGSVSVGEIKVDVVVQGSGESTTATGSGVGQAGQALGLQMAQAARAVVIQMGRSGELTALIRAGN